MNHPSIENAPGLAWRLLKKGWECRWIARRDIVRRGWTIRVSRLWVGFDISPLDIAYIQDRANSLQNEMLIFGRGGHPVVATFNNTLAGLIDCYQNDKDSPYHKGRSVTRDNYDGLCKRIRNSIGETAIADIKARDLLRWHDEWSDGGKKVTIAHSFITMLRILSNFGATIMEDAECDRLATVLHRMKFKQGKPRNSALSAEQAAAIRAEAHRRGYHGIALAQAFQFDCMLRQKDVIGELVPFSEPGPPSAVLLGNEKWMRGITWKEIDVNLVLHHITSKRNKLIDIPLREAPMVMAELRRFAKVGPGIELSRDMLPADGPIVINNKRGGVWSDQNFRRQWRIIATAAGVPKDVFNMDSRAGAISEATDAGADLEHVRHAATHGDIAMTQRYSRNSSDKVAGVMRTRAAHRTSKEQP